MKRLLLTLALTAAASLPIAASAQQGPPGPPNPPTTAQRTQMRANMEQMRKMHEQFRAQILGALTPEHRQLLASIAGNLAIAPQPDYRAAVRQLDDALSPAEKSAILADEKQMREQMRAQMKAMMASMPKRPWPHPSGAMQRSWKGSHTPHEMTAGAILLGAASGRGMMFGGWHGAHGGPPQH